MLGKPPYCIAIWDRHELTRLALHDFLDAHPRFNVAPPQDSLSAVLAQITHDPSPFILLFDMAQLLDGHAQYELMVHQREAEAANPAKLILASYASFAYDHHIDAALMLGVRAYVLKSSPLAVLTAALTALTKGQTFFDQSVATRIIAPDEQTSSDSNQPPLITRRSLLSKREWEVLGLVAEGFKAKEIAKSLHISAKTVDRHKANLMTKLAIHSQIGLTRYALAELPPKH